MIPGSFGGGGGGGAARRRIVASSGRKCGCRLTSSCRCLCAPGFLQELHGMFDQVDHAKVLRNDTQAPAAEFLSGWMAG